MDVIDWMTRGRFGRGSTIFAGGGDMSNYITENIIAFIEGHPLYWRMVSPELTSVRYIRPFGST
jgi:hypothetical protein